MKWAFLTDSSPVGCFGIKLVVLRKLQKKSMKTSVRGHSTTSAIRVINKCPQFSSFQMRQRSSRTRFFSFSNCTFCFYFCYVSSFLKLKISQWFSRHPFVCAVCHSKPRVLRMEIRRSRMSAFLTSYAHAFCTVTWRDLVLHVWKNRKRRSLLYREWYPFQKFAIPLENLQFHWSMYPYERGSVSTVVCHLFVVRVPERSAVCSQALCAVSGEASANFERPSRSNFSFDSRQQAIVV